MEKENPQDIPLGFLQQLPIWKEALKAFVAEGFPPGHVVPHDWFYDKFEIKMPGPDDVVRVSDLDKAKLRFVSLFVPFHSELDERYGILLKNIPGKGYQVVPLHLRVRTISDRLAKATGDEYRRAAKAYENTRIDEMTAEQRNELFEAKGRLLRLHGFARQVRREKPPVSDPNALAKMPPKLKFGKRGDGGMVLS